MNAGNREVVRLVVAFLVAMVAKDCFAEGVDPSVEYKKKIKSTENVAQLTQGLFGDESSLYNGSTRFRVVDISIPGNSGLSVEFSRTLSVELQPQDGQVAGYDARLKGLGNWDVDVPYISATYPSQNGWNSDRCTLGSVPSTVGQFNRREFWNGINLSIPGRQEVPFLSLLSSSVPRPSDGVTYRYATVERDVVDCVPMKSGLSGDGFRVTTVQGLKYYFDIAVMRADSTLHKTYSPTTDSTSATQNPVDYYLKRNKYFILASRVEDRFGNWVSYSYDADGHPTEILGSDGRRIDVSYADGRVKTVSVSGRTWTYDYGTAANETVLSKVSIPDGTKWSYSYSDSLRPSQPPDYENLSSPWCRSQAPMIGAMFVLNATHPSGAMGSFTFENTRHYRAGVHASECSSSLPVKGGEPMYTLLTPHYFDVMSLTKKEIKDGFSYKWSYSYNSTPSLSSALLWGSPTEAPAYPCQDCNSRKVVTITQPDGSQLVKEFGNVYRLNDGRLLKEEIKNASQQVVQSSSIAYANAQSAGGVFYESYGGSLAGIADPETLAVAPEAKRVTARDGTSYSKTVNSYDSFARPLNVTRASPWASRTDVAAYYDDTGKWILGLESSLTNSDTNIVVRRTTYNANAQPVTSEAFGKLKQTLSYNSDGTIAAVKDGKGNTTTLSSWKRGIPQLIQYADSTRQAAAVDDNGWVTSVTDENGFVTAYGYDVQGRLESITYPSDDSTGWNVVRQVFAPMAQAEYGVAAGHWRQVVSAGNARKVTYFDGLWRPLLTREYDAGNEVATQKFQRFSYDHESRVTFASYPGSSDGLTTGTWNNYDTLGRTTSVSQDSELGLLTSTTEYLSGNQTRVTDARGNKTLTGYQVFDQPAYDAPVWIQHPEGAVTEIARDVFGKPTSIRRHDAGNSVSLTRSYVYDGYQQLCKSIEPETGASANGYDAAGNIVWTASGLSLPSTSSCDADAAFGSGRRIDRSYDARNRITALAFPDGNGNQRWSYWPDGLVKQITTTNGGVATYNSYAYNKRRLLIAETQGQADGETWAMGYVYDANGNLAAHRYPSGQTVGYAPNALGQPTQAGSYATGVSYYPNGAIKQFTYGNGIVHTLTQNARQLPDTSQDAYGGTAFLSDGYDYDANGNVAGISDGATGRNQRGNRTMAYDGLDRLTSAVSPMFGTATYDYDVLDNLTHVVAPGRDHYYCYDGYWQLTNVKTGNCSGSTVIGMSYDVQGNLKNKNGQGFVFDYGNRLREATSKETYRYDGYGRRTLATQSAGAIGSMYDQAGVLRYQKNQRQSKATDYVMLGGSLVAEVDWPFGQTAAVKDYVNWTAVGGATRYVVEESVDGVTWTSVYEGADSSWTSLARPPSTYSYRVSACMPDGTCSAAGNIVHVQQPAFNIVPLLYQLLLN